MTASHPVRWIAERAWLPVLLVAIWWFASLGRDSLYFPSLQTIVETIRTELLGSKFTDTPLPSLGRFVAGFLIAATLGIVVGALIGLSPVLRAAVEPIVQFLRSLPPPVLLPIAMLLFGLGTTMNIAIIVLGSVWATLLSTIDGVSAVDGQLRDVARSYRLTWWQYISRVVLPSAGPQIFAGLRTTLQLSIILIVVDEMMGSTNGIGYYLLNSQQVFQVPQTWAATLVLGGIGYLTNLVFLQVEKRVLGAVGLAGKGGLFPWQMSGGMQQRAAIARGLAYQPDVLLMDEPFAAVDAQTRIELEDLVLRVRRDFDTTVLFVTHDIDEAVYLADRVLVLSGHRRRSRRTSSSTWRALATR